MSFLPSLPTFASLAASPYLHPPQPHPDPPKLHIAVTPLQPSTFAGEVFQAQISFKLAKTQPPPASSPSPSTPQTPRQPISVSASHADPPFSPERNSRDPISATPGRTFVPSHRVVQSLSSRGMDGTRGPIPQTAGPVMEAARRRSEFQGQPFLQGGHTPPLGYSSAMQLEKPGSEDIPPRRGQIGKQPRPKLAVLKQSATADSHSRQRSISGTELPSLRERKEPVLPDEPDAIGGSAKGRPTAPTPVRSHSISGIPTSETHSPLRGEMAVNGRNGAHIAGKQHSHHACTDLQADLFLSFGSSRLTCSDSDPSACFCPVVTTRSRHATVYPGFASTRPEAVLHAPLDVRVVVVVVVFTGPVASVRVVSPAQWKRVDPFGVHLAVTPAVRAQPNLRVASVSSDVARERSSRTIGRGRLSRPRGRVSHVRGGRVLGDNCSVVVLEPASPADGQLARPRPSTILTPDYSASSAKSVRPTIVPRFDHHLVIRTPRVDSHTVTSVPATRVPPSASPHVAPVFRHRNRLVPLPAHSPVARLVLTPSASSSREGAEFDEQLVWSREGSRLGPGREFARG